MLKKDLEELEVNKQCTICEHKEYAINGEWCYMQEVAPIKECKHFRLLRRLREAAAIRGLYNEFPELDK